MTAYIALVHKDADSDFGLSFPDFPGCITAGSTLDEVRAMAEEALALHIAGMAEDGEPIPEPSSPEAIMANPENHDGGVAVLIPAPPRPASTEYVTVTPPADMLRRIDRQAATLGLTRSGFLVAAAKRAMGGAA
jgi:predicted RNase H-like HicB family nuclease